MTTKISAQQQQQQQQQQQKTIERNRTQVNA